MIRPGTIASVTKAMPSNAIERKLDSEMQAAEIVPSAGWSVRLTMM